MREGIDLYNLPEDLTGLRAAVIRLREDFDSHIHDGSNSKQFETLHVQSLVANSSVLATRSLAVTKKNYSDNTAGFWTGLDGGTAKLFVGNATNYMKWTGSALQIAGEITATSGTIGGFTIGASTISANSGAISLNSSTSTITATNIQTNTSAPRIVLNASTAQFYESGGNNDMTISSGGSAISINITQRAANIAIYATYAATGARNFPLLKLEDTNQTADTSTSAEMVLVTRSNASASLDPMVKLLQEGGTGAVLDITQHSAAATVSMWVRQLDLDRTAIHVNQNASITGAADIGLVEITPSTSLAAALYLSSPNGVAHMRLLAATAPASPGNGDVWFDGSDLKIRAGGVTYTFTKT